jgi:hypothetical protein
MQRFLLSAGAFTLLAVALTGAKPGAKGAEVEGVEALAKKTTKKVHRGHDHLPQQAMRDKRAGTHRIHSSGGHHSHVVLQNGKVSGMQVSRNRVGAALFAEVEGDVDALKARKKGHVKVKAFRKGARRRASAATGAGDVEAAQFVGGYIVFYFFNPVLNQFVYFVWPIASVAPQVVNNTQDANGSDEQNVDVGNDE